MKGIFPLFLIVNKYKYAGININIKYSNAECENLVIYNNLIFIWQLLYFAIK